MVIRGVLSYLVVKHFRKYSSVVRTKRESGLEARYPREISLGKLWLECIKAKKGKP